MAQGASLCLRVYPCRTLQTRAKRGTCSSRFRLINGNEREGVFPGPGGGWREHDMFTTISSQFPREGFCCGFGPSRKGDFFLPQDGWAYYVSMPQGWGALDSPGRVHF